MDLKRFLAGLFRSTRSATQLEIVPEQSLSDDPDEQVLSQLAAAGADLSKPTHTLFYLYAASEAGANRIAKAIADSQLQTEVRPAAMGVGWLCLAQGQLVPSLAVLRTYRSRFEAMASAEGGEYDGWEAAVAR